MHEVHSPFWIWFMPLFERNKFEQFASVQQYVLLHDFIIQKEDTCTATKQLNCALLFEFSSLIRIEPHILFFFLL